MQSPVSSEKCGSITRFRWNLCTRGGSILFALLLTGCSIFPQVRDGQRIHNPFPQLKRIAVLPFYNQSSDPTLDQVAVAEAYYAALQAVPGFEVLPIGVVNTQLQQYSAQFGEPAQGPQYQHFAEYLGVEAVVVGAVTDFSAYYPPRMAITTHWYAANPGFHPIPPGYGLPWGTEAEKDIPRHVVKETEFELARQQLKTQTPDVFDPQEDETLPDPPIEAVTYEEHGGAKIDSRFNGVVELYEDQIIYDEKGNVLGIEEDDSQRLAAEVAETLPQQWPDPRGLIPDPPRPERPIVAAQSEPVLTHTRLYNGNDRAFTERLEKYVATSDDGRTGGWQGHLIRSQDFIRFCCYLHITEMLELRGGVDQSDLILRWPISRYSSQ